MIKIIFEFFAYKAEQSGASQNPCTKCILCCSRCMIWALDAYIKFMNKNAYIQIALHNNNFCQSAQAAFYLTVRHVGRFTASSIVGAMVAFLGKGCLIAFNVWICILLVPKLGADIKNVQLPMIIIGVLAYVISSLFLEIFSFSSTAILHCFILDEDFGGSDKTPDSLKEFLSQNERHNARKTEPHKMNQTVAARKNNMA